ncbi:hypothetical protein B0H16DRAFT_1494450 [Mycena metata]|uniref:Uncharacterized protein n=1 Tax=Mycena metata TaxID=1033252 RepID=A0AAD7KCJ6_9AGAR|nr:hypothetical protein B0H16DRAFT_1494450 [Mycena metata]
MLIEQVLTASFVFSLTSSVNCLTLTLRYRGPTNGPTPLPTPLNLPRANHAHIAGTSSSVTIIIAASVAIGTGAFLLALIFCIFWRRINSKRHYHKSELGRYQAGFPAEVKRPLRPAIRLVEMPTTQMLIQHAPPKAYLDSPRPRRTSLIARDPGFLARPIPSNVPVSVANSRPSSTSHSHLRHQSSVSGSTHIPPEELSDLLEELSRHYVLTDPTSKSPKDHRHHRSTSSFTRRSRVYS